MVFQKHIWTSGNKEQWFLRDRKQMRLYDYPFLCLERDSDAEKWGKTQEISWMEEMELRVEGD